MEVTCSADSCPVILNSSCVFYESGNLLYTGITTNDSLQVALKKIDATFKNASVGYAFINGLDLISGNQVGLGGSLLNDTSITGNYLLSLEGQIESSAFITTGGSSSDFVKGDGSLDNASYQVSGNYITALTGDVLASGPGSVVATLATVLSSPGTYGSSVNVPTITVDAKGRITSITNTAIALPSASLSFSGDLSGAGTTGAAVTLTLNTVNGNVYGSNNLLKFAVNGKGLVTSAAPITSLDIDGLYGYTPVPQDRTITINGVTKNLVSNRSWIVGGVWGGITGTITDQTDLITYLSSNYYSISNPSNYISKTDLSAGTGINYNSVSGVITNSAPDQTVVLSAGSGISISGTYPNFTITNSNPPGGGGTVTSVTGTGTVSGITLTGTVNTSGNLTLGGALVVTPSNFSSQSANTFLAAPDGSSGAPTFRTIAVNDVPILNQNTTGSAATLTTPRNIQGVPFNGSVNIDIINGTGFIKAIGTTLVYDNSTYLTTIAGLNISQLTNDSGYITSSSLIGYTPTSRTLTINGISYDLSANRLWTVGDVVSSGSYSDPSWITSLAYSKLTGAPTNLSSFTNDVGYITSSSLSPYLTITSAAATYQPIGTYATASNSMLFTNKSGNISQWTNDVGYLTSTGITPAALTKVDDTNITLTLGGTPNTALLQAVSITVGWTGTLADGRIASSAVWNAKQDALVSGTNIKTINSNSILGPGNLTISATPNIITATLTFTFLSEQDIVVNTVLSALITSTNIASFTWIPIDTSDTSLDDFKLNGVSFNIENIVDNTSFDIKATALNGATGIYTIKYIITY